MQADTNISHLKNQIRLTKSDFRQHAIDLLESSGRLREKVYAIANSESRGVRLMTELCRFMALSGQFRITKELDEVWHAFILDTRVYCDYCSCHVGEYVHHEQPNEPGFFGSIDRTIAALREQFGPIDEEIWGQTELASCGRSSK